MSKRSKKAPGRADRVGITLIDAVRRFGDEKEAERWLIEQRWPDGVICPNCGTDRPTVRKPRSDSALQYFSCRTRKPKCGKTFSIKTDTIMHNSKLKLSQWCLAYFLSVSNLKGVSSMKLHRDLGITQKTAWHLGQRIRRLMETQRSPFEGPVEVDETYMGGKERNKHEWKKQNDGRGTVGKFAVVGIRDRDTNQVEAEVVESTDAPTLQGFVKEHTYSDAMVYTDDARAYIGLPRAHETVKHSVAEFVNGQAHTNGIESFWSVLKRGYVGVYHHFSAKHLHRYISEFAGRHNLRDLDTIRQMQELARRGEYKRLTYASLIGDENTRQPRLIKDWE